MLDELLPYYNDELAFIRRLVFEYAADHDKIASRLKIGREGSEDPHVSRLIEAFALLNARIRYKLDDDFPELTDALLGALYPHYQAPIPSMAIVQLSAAPDLSAPYPIKAGSRLETAPIDGEPCRFRTCYDTTLWPVKLGDANYKPSTAAAPPPPPTGNATAVLQIELTGTSSDAPVDKLAPDSLAFYLRGDPPITQGLYQSLLNEVVHVLVASSSEDPTPIALGASAIEPIGFSPDEGLLPYPKQAFLGYRLLTEYFVFPEKFGFVRFTGLSRALSQKGEHPSLYVYFRRAHAGFETGIDRNTFVLGCTPIINLFSREAEPIELKHTVTRYWVDPDARRPKATEVYSIDSVTASDTKDGARVTFTPFYGADHWAKTGEVRTFWTASRRSGPTANPGSDVDITFVDLDFDPTTPPTRTARVSITCVNRDLPARLPFGGGEPRLKLETASPAVARVNCLTPPTRTLRPPLRGPALWRLVSHLNLNHLSVSDGEQGARALREILALYDFKDSPESRSRIESILGVRSRTGSARLVFEEQLDSDKPPLRRSVLTRGIDIELELSDRRFPSGGAYLFASILDRFLAHYCTMNAFTRVTAKLRNQEEALAKWPARNGDRILV